MALSRARAVAHARHALEPGDSRERIAVLHLCAVGERFLEFIGVRRRETRQHDKRFAEDDAQPRHCVIASLFDGRRVR